MPTIQEFCPPHFSGYLHRFKVILELFLPKGFYFLKIIKMRKNRNVSGDGGLRRQYLHGVLLHHAQVSETIYTRRFNAALKMKNTVNHDNVYLNRG